MLIPCNLHSQDFVGFYEPDKDKSYRDQGYRWKELEYYNRGKEGVVIKA